VFVVTYAEPEEMPEEGVYTFVIDGIESGLEQAKTAAADKDVAVIGGTEIGQQYIRTGLINGILIFLVPVLLGSGTTMFEHLGEEHKRLQSVWMIETPQATYLRFRVVE